MTKKTATKKTAKSSNGFFKVRYVSFSSSNVNVDLNGFLSTARGKEIVKNAVKRASAKEKSASLSSIL